VAKVHPVFDGLDRPGVMDWDYYGRILSHTLLDSPVTPDDVAAVAFALGHSSFPGGYCSGVMLAAYTLGAGRWALNTFRILEHLDRHPAADRLLLNLIRYAQRDLDAPLAALPPDFSDRLPTPASSGGAPAPTRAYSPFKRTWRLSPHLPGPDRMEEVALPADDALAWTPIASATDFVSILYEADGERQGLVYARGEIEAAEAMSVDLLIGMDGPVKAWVDADAIGLVPRSGNPAVPDKAAFPVALAPGRHTVTVALDRRGGRAWGFFLRFASRAASDAATVPVPVVDP
jgi:hypothetical protein